MLIVRSRKREHLKRLFPDRTVSATPRRDYAFRTSIPRQELADFVSVRIQDIAYQNFKASVRDTALHDLYLDFWGLHLRYQVETVRNP